MRFLERIYGDYENNCNDDEANLIANLNRAYRPSDGESEKHNYRYACCNRLEECQR